MTRFNGKEVTSASQLRNAVAATDPDSRATLEFYRDGKRDSVTVMIGQLDEEDIAMARGGGRAATEQLGMTVENLSPELARRLDVGRDERGVVVTEVDRGSLAARVGIRPGDLIVAISGKSIKSTADFREAIRGLDSQDGIRMQVQRDGARRYVFLRSR